MPNLNKVMLIGHLTRDPEMRYTPKGTAVAKFGLAVNREWKTDSGEKKKDVVFIDIDAFGRQAETISQYVKKGHPPYVEGRLKLDTWEDKNSHEKKSKITVTLENFQFLKSADPSDRSDSSDSEDRPASHDTDDDVPF